MYFVTEQLSKENLMSNTSLPTPEGQPVPGPPPGGSSPGTPVRSRRWAAAGLAGGLLAGTAAGLIMGVPGVSSAATDSAPVAIVQQTDTDESTTTTADADAARPEPGERLREALEPLVTDGTITSAQADAVSEHLAASRPDRPGRRGHRLGNVSEVVTEVLGLEAEELREQLRAGNSLADIAETQGVELEVLISALVDEAQDKIDEAVADGKLSADEAAERLEDIEERVTARVNGERPEGRRGGPFGPRGG